MKKLYTTLIAVLAIMQFSYAQQWTTSGSNIYNNNTGNVGIGTTSPQYRLSISNGGALEFEVDPTAASGNQVNIFAYNRSASMYGILAFNAALYTFNLGNVGIGTTNPGSQLDISIMVQAPA